MKNDYIEHNGVRVEFVTVTPALAQEWLKFNIKNRRVRDKTVACYAKDMKEGRWVTNGDSIRFDKNHTLIDGQHRCLAVIKSNTPITTLLVSELRDDSYPTIDSGASRTAGDALQRDIKNAHSISAIVRKYMALCSRKSIAKDGGFDKMSNARICEEYYKHPSTFIKANALASKCYDSCNAFNVSLLGGTYAYLVLDKHHSETTVTDFLVQLADIIPSHFSVIRECRKVFINDRLSDKTHLENRVKQTVLIKTWNYFIMGKDVTRLQKVYDKDIWFI